MEDSSESQEFLTPFSSAKNSDETDEGHEVQLVEQKSVTFQFDQLPVPESQPTMNQQSSRRTMRSDTAIRPNLPRLEAQGQHANRRPSFRPTLSRQSNATTRNDPVHMSRRHLLTMNMTKLGKFLQRIEPFIIACISINSIMIGIGTFNFIDKNPTNKRVFEIIDDVFLYIFTVELALNLIWYFRLDRIAFDGCMPYTPAITAGERSKRRRDRPWIIFDIIIIGLSWIFRGSAGGSSNASVFRAFRILRTFRLLSKVKSLKNLMRALVHVFPKMGALSVITMIMFIVFGTLTTQLFRGTAFEGDVEYDYFGSFQKSCLTLFQMMTFDNWHDPARAIMGLEKFGWTWIIFVVWVFFSGFVIMNLIIAIICESLVTMNEMGIMALHGQVDGSQSVTDFERSMQDVTAVKMELSTALGIRLTQLEASVDLLLENENEILQRLEMILESKKI